MYVIIVESGEYSDRDDWIGGIYNDKEEAQRVLAEKSAVARQHQNDYDEWCEKQLAEEEALRKLRRKLKVLYEQNGPFNEKGEPRYIDERHNLEEWHKKRETLMDSIRELEKVVKPRYPCPIENRGERFYIVEVPIGIWGTYCYT